MTARDLLRGLADRGVVLSVSGDTVKYRAPRRILTVEDRALLAEHREALRDYLRRLAPYLSSLVPALLARLADAGFHVVLANGPRIEAAEGADDSAVDPAVVDAVNDRLDELVAFLRKSSADMTDAELRALGFRRRPNGVVMLGADAPEFGGGWSPPAGWGLDRREGA